MQERIREVVIKTLLIPEVEINGRSHSHGVRWDSCFELFGFDILLDKRLKPWLLEINCLPSISSSSPLDKYIKCRLCTDTFHLLGLKPIDFRSEARKKLKQQVNLESPRVRRRHVFELLKNDFRQDVLHEDDATMLRELYEQFQRAPSLQCIFPTQERVQKFKDLFSVQRYNNILLWKFLELSDLEQRSLLSRCSKRI